MWMCESCAKPLTDSNRGTQADGSSSEMYCDACFQSGAFVSDLALEQMRVRVTEALEGKGIPSFVRKRIVANVGNLERWKGA